MKKIFEKILIDDREYQVVIEKKKIKNCYFRFYNGQFHASCPYFYPKKLLLNSLKLYAKKLIKEPRINLEKHTIQILGEKVYSKTNTFNVFGFTLTFVDEDDFYKKIKPILWKYISNRVEVLRKTMNVPIEYKVRVQKMKSRLGSNSKATNTLNFTLKLIHFSKEAIDSVIIHELAHYFKFDHSKEFYDVVYKYCPNYDKLNKEFKD